MLVLHVYSEGRNINRALLKQAPERKKERREIQREKTQRRNISAVSLDTHSIREDLPVPTQRTHKLYNKTYMHACISTAAQRDISKQHSTVCSPPSQDRKKSARKKPYQEKEVQTGSRGQKGSFPATSSSSFLHTLLFASKSSLCLRSPRETVLSFFLSDSLLLSFFLSGLFTSFSYLTDASVSDLRA